MVAGGGGGGRGWLNYFSGSSGGYAAATLEMPPGPGRKITFTIGQGGNSERCDDRIPSQNCTEAKKHTPGGNGTDTVVIQTDSLNTETARVTAKGGPGGGSTGASLATMLPAVFNPNTITDKRNFLGVAGPKNPDLGHSSRGSDCGCTVPEMPSLGGEGNKDARGYGAGGGGGCNQMAGHGANGYVQIVFVQCR